MFAFLGLTLFIGSAGQSAAPAAAQAIARIDGQDVTLDQFRDWMVATHGWRFVDDYVDLVLLRRELERAGQKLPTRADLDAAFEELWHDHVLFRFRGDEEAFLNELAQAGIDKAGFRARQLGSLEQGLLARRILCARTPNDAQLRELYAREFGADGVRTHVRVAFFSRIVKVAPKEKATKQQNEERDGAARARAEKFLAAVKADASAFDRLARGDSDLLTIERFDHTIADLRDQGGDLPRLLVSHFGGALNAALKDTKPGELVGPVQAGDGWFVAQLVERSNSTFESTKDELLAMWRERPPSATEVHFLKQELRAKAKIEKLPLESAGG